MSLMADSLLSQVKDNAQRVIELLQNYDFDSFLIGIRLPNDVDQAIKKELAIKIGSIVSSSLDKRVDFSRPDITVILDYSKDIATPPIQLEIRSLYVYGKYQKLSRDIPQTKWLCPKCHGKGCHYCNFMGKLYPTSVEEEIGRVLLDLTGGSGTKFHGAGREDRDALMIGWRPFVIEILNPIVRNIDLGFAQSAINKSSMVKVKDLTIVDRSKVIELKSAKYDKTYEALVECGASYDQSKIHYLEQYFVDRVIQQRTPSRVAHRRSDIIRKRRVYMVKCTPIDSTKFKAVIRAESGTYIKELVSGDDGRTTPSFSEVLGVDCRVVELNVLEVHLV